MDNGPLPRPHVLRSLREADAPTPAETAATRPGPLARVKAALTPKRPASEAPTTPAPAPPSTPAPESPKARAGETPPLPKEAPVAPHLPKGVALPPSMRIEGGQLHMTSPYRIPETQTDRRTPETFTPRHIPPDQRPRELDFAPVAKSQPRTTWLSPAEINLGQQYFRDQRAARAKALEEQAAQGGPDLTRTPEHRDFGRDEHWAAPSVVNWGGLARAHTDLLQRLNAQREGGESVTEPHTHDSGAFAREFMNLAEPAGMIGTSDLPLHGYGSYDPYYGSATDPSTWETITHHPESLRRYKWAKERMDQGAPNLSSIPLSMVWPKDVPQTPLYQSTPEEFLERPEVLHRGGTGQAPKEDEGEEGAMWLTPHYSAAQNYAALRMGPQRYDLSGRLTAGRSPYDAAAPGPSITSGLPETSKYANEGDIAATLGRLGLRMEDLESHLPSTDGGLRLHQALYFPGVLEDLKRQGFGAYEGAGAGGHPFYVKFPGTKFLQHGDLIRQAHAQDLDVGDDNRKRYSLGAPRTTGGTRWARRGPPVMQTPTGPRVPEGHYTTPTSPAYDGVREAGPGELPTPDWLKTVPPTSRWWTVRYVRPNGKRVEMHALLDEDQTAVGAHEAMHGAEFKHWASLARKYGGRLIRHPEGAPPPKGALEQPNFVYAPYPYLLGKKTAQQGFWRALEMARSGRKVRQFPGQKFIDPLEMQGPDDPGGTSYASSLTPEVSAIVRAHLNLETVQDSLNKTYGEEPKRGKGERLVDPPDMARKEQAQRAFNQAHAVFGMDEGVKVRAARGSWAMPNAAGGTRTPQVEPPDDPLMPPPVRADPKPPHGPHPPLPRAHKIPEGPSGLDVPEDA